MDDTTIIAQIPMRLTLNTQSQTCTYVVKREHFRPLFCHELENSRDEAKKRTGIRSGYLRRIFSPSARRFSNGFSSL